ncbi:MAG: hypothetical protein ABFS19_02690 [Thermodesulfobacteriota bacterium]
MENEMNGMTPTQKIKAGFWLGIGFMIPLTLASIVTLVISVAATPLIVKKSFEQVEEVQEDNTAFDFANQDLKDQVEIVERRESRQGNRLLILGVVANNGPKQVGSINIQAELFDEKGEFVFECDEYISRKIKTGDKENFQIRCGCGDEKVPEYKTMNLRIISANNY